MSKHLRNLAMAQPIRLRSFRRLFFGEGIAVFADQMLLVALTLLALRVAGPGFALGSVLAVAAIPGALLMPLGGWVSDRFSPPGVLLLCGIGRALIASALVSVVLLEVSSPWPLYALAVLWASSTPCTTRPRSLRCPPFSRIERSWEQATLW